MTGAQYRSRSWRRLKKSGTHGPTMRYERRGADVARCSCGRVLTGVQVKGAKSRKNVSRPYGGALCAICTRRLMIEKARSGAI